MSTSATRIEPMYVVDTHALIWYLTGHKRLSPRARMIFDEADKGNTRIIISAIVIAEMYFADHKSTLFVDFGEMYRQIKAKPTYQFVPFHPDDVLDFATDASVPEMHDRIITGLARRLGVSLLTSDPLIVASGVVKVEW